MASALAQLLLSSVGLFGSLLAAWTAWRQKRRIGEQLTPAPTLTDRIETLRENLGQSSTLINEINAELQLQTAALERIRAEAEENQRLAALHREEADAVRQLVSTTIEGAQSESVKQSKRSSWLFFLAGLLFSVPLGVGVNFLYDLITK